MITSTSSSARNSIVERCINDDQTRLRLKYNPYYLPFDKQVGSHVWLDGKELIMLSSNDYLGLSDHPKVIEAGKKALEDWGGGTTGSRFANGSRYFHEKLEADLANFLGKEACHVSVAGYISCMSSIESFARKGDLIIVDRNVHSSLWAGIANTGARLERFGHNNTESLKEVLAIESPDVAKILVVEGVFSMEGHIANLLDYLAVTQNQNCFIVVDDAHGFGVLGEQGRGTVDHFGATDQVDIIAGSMSKSMGSTGGFVAGSNETIEYLRTHSKQTVFSAALSPCQTACAQAALDVMQTEPEHLQRLWDNTRYYHKLLLDLDLDIWGSETPATPIVLGKIERAYYFWKKLMKKGIFTNIIPPPAVLPNKILIRTAISARHTKEDLEKIGEAMAFAAKGL
jgi:7-keto-8-aminopelargonate synthetase-like enzyme